MVFSCRCVTSDTSEGHPSERPVDVLEGKERSDVVIVFRSVSGEKWLRSRQSSRLCRAHEAKRSVSRPIMPFCCFASEKGVVGAKYEQTPMDSAFTPVEKEEKLRWFFVEKLHANPYK